MNTFFQIVSLTWSFTGGQFQNEAIAAGQEFYTASPYFVTTEFEFQAPFSWQKGGEDQVFMGGSLENRFVPHGELSFAPWQDTYTFKSGVRLYGAEFGYEHQCIHPVVVQGEAISSFFKGYDKFYFKIEGKL
jgi:hypothetical protein